MRLLAFGNSHVKWIFSCTPEIETHFIGTLTMDMIGRNGTAFVRERADIEGDCKIIFSFGGLDVRCYLVRPYRQGGEGVLLDIVSRYLESIAALKRSTSPEPMVYVLGLIPPMDPLRVNPDFPPVGTISERIEVRRIVNEQMKRSSSDYGLGYIDIPKSYETLAGSLKLLKSDGHAHIAQDSAGDIVQAVSAGIAEKLSGPSLPWRSRIGRTYERARALIDRDADTMWRLGMTEDDRILD